MGDPFSGLYPAGINLALTVLQRRRGRGAAAWATGTRAAASPARVDAGRRAAESDAVTYCLIITTAAARPPNATSVVPTAPCSQRNSAQIFITYSDGLTYGADDAARPGPEGAREIKNLKIRTLPNAVKSFAMIMTFVLIKGRMS
ncbi:hypothetical protein EVAR_22077_1 [Eumeta japonica]|uniref:Uncharacterized protein n=1 Tax=Eumeta variegata TaxID=151549 RepID=A0A4C1USP6_EUMVA|nr:hypothetical protein EVAR_22077_1 [Eumeta japonica]